MSEYILDQRRRALENSFFAEVDKELLERLKQEMDQKEERESLAQFSGITDDVLLDRLIHRGIRSSTWAALSLVPLVEVAWSDGHMSDREQEAILKAADDNGIATDSPAHQLLEQWLKKRPDRELRVAWKEYVQELVKSGTPEGIAAFRNNVLDRAQAIAELSGSFLGMGSSISKEEQEVLDDLETALR